MGYSETKISPMILITIIDRWNLLKEDVCEMFFYFMF